MIADFLPGMLADWLMRRRVTIPAPAALTYRIATTRAELEQAFQLASNRFGTAGPHQGALSVSMFNALPSTAVVVAKSAEHVVGAATVIKDSPLGLPIDDHVDLNLLRQSRRRCVQVVDFGFLPQFRQPQSVFPLCKFLRHYCAAYLGADDVIVHVAKPYARRLRSLLLFKPLVSAHQTTSRGRSFRHASLTVDLRAVEHEAAAVYARRPAARNLHEYFFRAADPHLQFPDRTYQSAADPVMTPADLTYFFRQRSSVFAALGDRERTILRTIYHHPSYLDVIPPAKSGQAVDRLAPRFDFHGKGQLLLTNEHGVKIVAVKITNVSQGGVGILLDENVRLNVRSRCKLKVAISEFEIATLEGRVRWEDDTGHCGFEILTFTPNWEFLIHHLEKDHTRINSVAK